MRHGEERWGEAWNSEAWFGKARITFNERRAE